MILQKLLGELQYNSELVKVTTVMKEVVPNVAPLETEPIDRRYETHIVYANELRRIFDRRDVLASMCSVAISAYRSRKGYKKGAYIKKQAFILDQFKRPEEIRALRRVYGRLFVCVSIYSAVETRVQFLADEIALGDNAPRPTNEHEARAKKLVARDEDEEGIPDGQRLRDAFPLADIFVNIDDIGDAEDVLRRFLIGLFGSNRISPTRDEVGLYYAKSSSLRSMDLSRQVGAAIFGAKGEIVSLGYNEVPQAGGGVFDETSVTDARDHVHGRDENERIKRALLADVVGRLIESKLVETKASGPDLVKAVLDDALKKGSVLRDALLMDLLEFGRVIHAEMHAITEAARFGRSLSDGTLYCTTFPCHICAKHIIASGIHRVVFIEPYPKSYARELNSCISIKAGQYNGVGVQFSPFIGVAPSRFKELFERGRRKGLAGEFSEWITGRPHPVVDYTIATYLQNEEAVRKAFQKRLLQLKKNGVIKLSKAKAPSH